MSTYPRQNTYKQPKYEQHQRLVVESVSFIQIAYRNMSQGSLTKTEMTKDSIITKTYASMVDKS